MRSLILHALLLLALALPAQAQRTLALPAQAQRTLAAKPLPGAIELSLSAKPARERRAIKAAALAAVGKVADFAATKSARTFDIELREAPVVENGVLTVYARARVAGEVVGLGVRAVEWERLRFVNPPVKVPAGTYREETVGGELVQVENMREDAGAALREIIAQAIGQIATTGPPAKRGSVGHTTTTIYPDAGNATGGSVDGGVLASAGANTWDFYRDHAGTTHTATSAHSYGCAWGSGAWGNFDRIDRGVFTFDTSRIGTDRIVSATLSIYGQASVKADPDGNAPSADVVSYAGSADTLAASDFAKANFGTVAFASIAFADLAAAYNDFALNQAGINTIVGGGVTKFGLRTSHDRTDTEPITPTTADTYFYIRFADYSGSVSDPKFVVEHYPRGPRNLLGSPL